MFIDKKMKKFEYSITGNNVVPQNMIGDIFFGTPCMLQIYPKFSSLNFAYVIVVILFVNLYEYSH